MKWIPYRIRTLRFELGDLSRPAFAKKVGVKEQTIYRWEKGKTVPMAIYQFKLDLLEKEITEKLHREAK